MLKRWIKSVIRECLQPLEYQIKREGDKVEYFERIMGQIDYTHFDTQMGKLNTMMKELKGIVSMSRAALDEGRKFTEIREIGNILNKTSQEIHRLESLNDRFTKQVEEYHYITDKLVDYFCEYTSVKSNNDKNEKTKAKASSRKP